MPLSVPRIVENADQKASKNDPDLEQPQVFVAYRGSAVHHFDGCQMPSRLYFGEVSHYGLTPSQPVQQSACLSPRAQGLNLASPLITSRFGTISAHQLAGEKACWLHRTNAHPQPPPPPPPPPPPRWTARAPLRQPAHCPVEPTGLGICLDLSRVPTSDLALQHVSKLSHVKPSRFSSSDLARKVNQEVRRLPWPTPLRLQLLDVASMMMRWASNRSC